MKNVCKTFGFFGIVAIIAFGSLLALAGCGGGAGAHTHTWAWAPTSEGIETETCSCGETNGIRLTLAVGDNVPGRGIIVYKSEVGFTVEMVNPADNYTAHYLEAAPDNMAGTLAWSTTNVLIENGLETIGTDDYGDRGDGVYQHSEAKLKNSIGKGRKNTALILGEHGAAGAPAANACDSAGYGGKTDWFLPSLGELNEMYKALEISSGFFWSSSQSNSGYAWGQDFDVGDQGNASKYYDGNVRAVRAF